MYVVVRPSFTSKVIAPDDSPALDRIQEDAEKHRQARRRRRQRRRKGRGKK